MTEEDTPLAVLGRQYDLVCAQNQALAAQLRETEAALARVYVLNDKLKAALRERDNTGGHE